MPSPYDPYVPWNFPGPQLRADAIRRSHGRIPAQADDDLYRLVDLGTGAVVKQGSRDACLDHVLDAWQQTLWVPEPHARARAEGVALRLRFERWDDLRPGWVAETSLTNAVVDQHAAI